jgi:hypothetical protein
MSDDAFGIIEELLGGETQLGKTDFMLSED